MNSKIASESESTRRSIYFRNAMCDVNPIIWLTIAPFLFSSAAAAQLAPSQSGVTPSDRLFDVPALKPPESKPPALIQPRLKPPLNRQREIGTGPRVFVRKFNLRGNTVFDDDDLAIVTAPYENRAITNDELQELRHSLTLRYVNHGYITSGALIPDQKVVDGVIKILIVEGRLAEVLVEGNQQLRPDYISDRLKLGAGPPLNIHRLQQQIQIVLQDRNIEIINGALRPGDQLGEVILEAKVKESPRYDFTMNMDNQLSPSLGELRGVVQGSIRNLTGRGDSLSTEFSYAKGARNFSVDYSIPVSARDTTLHFWFDRDDFVVQEAPFDQLDIEGDTTTAGLEITHPFFRTPQHRLLVGIGVEYRESQTFLLGEGFAFAPGVDPDGKSSITVVSFTQDWLDRSADQVIAARSNFRFGIDAFDATINKTGPDGEFFSWLGQFQWIRRLGDKGNQLHFRTHLQLTDKALLPLEQFTVGGMRCARGYRKNELVRDMGYCASLEVRIPVVRNETGGALLQLAPFGDIGSAWYKNQSTPHPRELASIGLGLLWDPHPKVHGELYWGHAFTDIPHPSNTTQDEGFHFLLNVDIF